jgi:hypothetical protein
MLVKFYAVRCDRCGCLSTARSDMPSEARQARALAKRYRFKRLDVPAKYGGTTKVDVCDSCAPVVERGVRTAKAVAAAERLKQEVSLADLDEAGE